MPETQCQRCGQDYPGRAIQPETCPNCSGRTLHFSFGTSAYRSDDHSRELMHALKYRRQLHLAETFGRLMGCLWDDPRLSSRSHWVIVPVPLHPKRMRERRFNQAAELAKAFARTAPDTIAVSLEPKLICRTDFRERQAQLERADRLENVKNSFQLTRRGARFTLPAGAGILLLDDVMTTGATLSESAKVLRPITKKANLAAISALRG